MTPSKLRSGMLLIKQSHGKKRNFVTMASNSLTMKNMLMKKKTMTRPLLKLHRWCQTMELLKKVTLLLTVRTHKLWMSIEGPTLCFSSLIPNKKWTWEYVLREAPKIPKHLHVLVVANYRDLGQHWSISKQEMEEFALSCGPLFRFAELSVLNKYGLKSVLAFLNIPYLYTKLTYLEDLVMKCEQDIDWADEEFDMINDEQNYEFYARWLENNKNNRRQTSEIEAAPRPQQFQLGNASTSTADLSAAVSHGQRSLPRQREPPPLYLPANKRTTHRSEKAKENTLTQPISSNLKPQPQEQPKSSTSKAHTVQSSNHHPISGKDNKTPSSNSAKHAQSKEAVDLDNFYVGTMQEDFFNDDDDDNEKKRAEQEKEQLQREKEEQLQREKQNRNNSVIKSDKGIEEEEEDKGNPLVSPDEDLDGPSVHQTPLVVSPAVAPSPSTTQSPQKSDQDTAIPSTSTTSETPQPSSSSSSLPVLPKAPSSPTVVHQTSTHSSTLVSADPVLSEFVPEVNDSSTFFEDEEENPPVKKEDEKAKDDDDDSPNPFVQPDDDLSDNGELNTKLEGQHHQTQEHAKTEEDQPLKEGDDGNHQAQVVVVESGEQEAEQKQEDLVVVGFEEPPVADDSEKTSQGSEKKKKDKKERKEKKEKKAKKRQEYEALE
eukprot:TRINITY_DN5179_c0_g1_i1.p1 TRINITY_DN5179_c0_g1~~TRINITY_DN5179_c0_g1_i1.p1  ORF type:complete len:657 (-),score=167.34 TRINITY_DN5179_c0_g1_i1:233-2203(-)